MSGQAASRNRLTPSSRSFVSVFLDLQLGKRMVYYLRNTRAIALFVFITIVKDRISAQYRARRGALFPARASRLRTRTGKTHPAGKIRPAGKTRPYAAAQFKA